MPRLHRFLLWLGSAIVGAVVTVVATLFAAASVWPSAKSFAETVFSAALALMAEPAFWIISCVIVVGYFISLTVTFPREGARKRSPQLYLYTWPPGFPGGP